MALHIWCWLCFGDAVRRSAGFNIGAYLRSILIAEYNGQPSVLALFAGR